MQKRAPIPLCLITGLALLAASMLHAAGGGGRMLLDLAVAGGAADKE